MNIRMSTTRLLFQSRIHQFLATLLRAGILRTLRATGLEQSEGNQNRVHIVLMSCGRESRNGLSLNTWVRS
jgi:hypothetical protein